MLLILNMLLKDKLTLHLYDRDDQMSQSDSKFNQLALEELFQPPMVEFLECNRAVGKIFSLSMALKLHIFDLIESKGNKPYSAQLIQQGLGTKFHPKQMLSLLNQLRDQGLLEMNNNMEYFNTEYTTRFFTEKSDENYIGIYKNIDRHVMKFSQWENKLLSNEISNQLEESFKSKEETRNLIDLFYTLHCKLFSTLVQKFNFGNYNRILDCYCRNGDLAGKIKLTYNNAQVIAMDHSIVEDFAKEHLRRLEVGDKVQLQFWHPKEDNLPECDVVISTHFLQFFFEDWKMKILKKLYDCLSKGGVLILIENLIHEDESDANLGENICFSFLAQNFEGYTMRPEEIKGMLLDVGFKDIEFENYNLGADVIFASK